MQIVIRSNYGDESIALIQWAHEHQLTKKANITVCSINTGWAAGAWDIQVKKGQALAREYGFEVVTLEAPMYFQDLILEKRSFPTKKFQWCAGFLKGVPFLHWLDEIDPSAEYLVALPKRQALYRTPIDEYIDSCEHHGERKVWHPMVSLSNESRDQLIEAAGFKVLNHRSLECDPCVNASPREIQHLSPADIQKTKNLEKELKSHFFAQYNLPIDKIQINTANELETKHSMDSFSMGCGDPFGCGL